MKLNIFVIAFVLKLVWCSKFDNKELKQVMIISRHSVRTPLLVSNETTPNIWPSWKEKLGYLTAKGAMLEGYMGEYFVAWLNENKVLPEHCPSEEDFYVYANFKQRTKASAKAFVEKGFPKCNVTVHFKADLDPLFNPVFHNSSDVFKQHVQEDMLERLNSLHMNDSYIELESILDYKNSEMCLKNHKCDLLTNKNKVLAEFGHKPNLSGPLKLSNSAVDSFLMQYYEGFDNRDIGWGKLTEDAQWRNVMELMRGYHNVIFNTSLAANDIAHPLLKYISNLFLRDGAPKVTFLMGHDSNMYTLINSLGFKPYELPEQFELTPIGGKLVFQKWLDTVTNKYFLRVDYVYQASLQLRTGSNLNLKNPPQFFTMQLEACKIDSNGFCPWDDFIGLLQTF